MTSSPKPSMYEALRRIVDARIAKVHVSMPGEVTEYDHEQQRATVRPIPRGRYYDEDESVQTYRFEPIANVPVAFPRATSYAITWPLSVGDQGQIVFSERCIDEWLATGDSDTTPQDFRRFDLKDAWFEPGAQSFANAIGSDGIDNAAMVVLAPELRLGSSSASDYVALASAVESELAAIWAVLSGHTHGGVQSGSSSTFASGTGSAGSVGATKVKAE